MDVVRALFLGTPEFAKVCLSNVIKDKVFEVVGVVTQPDRPKGRKLKLAACPVKQLAEAHSLPVISPENINQPDILKIIEAWKADVIIVVAFGQIIGEELLQMYPSKIVNVHGSLLPHLRGAAPIQRALIQGDIQTGVALQVMVKKLDAGDVIGVRKTLITKDKDALILHDELAQLGSELLLNELPDYLKGNIQPITQDETKVTYAAKLEKAEGKINWQSSAIEIFNLIRGMKLGPGTYTSFKGKKLKIHNAEVTESNGDLGCVAEILEDGFVVNCGQAGLKLLVVQPESKPRMSAADFVRGYQLNIGDQFGE